jgi:hypothetical protein
LAAPLTIKCGVSVWKPGGIGFDAFAIPAMIADSISGPPANRAVTLYTNKYTVRSF